MVFRLVEILEGVRAIDLSEADGLDLEAYLLECDEGVVLVDTGMLPSDLDKIVAELKDMGKTWKDLSLVLITHKHGDHINNLSKVKELTSAEILAGEGDVKDIEVATGVPIDRGIGHGDYFDFCGGIEAIHIPGHSLGNMSLYLQRHKTIIAGDTIFGDKKGNIRPPPEKYCLDLKSAEMEIKRLLFYDFDKLLLSHGKNLLTGAKSRVRMLCEEVALRT
jgi:glyoxylase-like metal-dependent hydrolase (beta-lactamase superfamily II)